MLLFSSMSHSVILVFWYALLTAVATGLGALPFFFLKKVTPKAVGVCNALASGLMVGASVQLIVDGARISLMRVVAGLVVGGLFIFAAHYILEKRNIDADPAELAGANLRKIIMIIAIMTVHSFAEGVSIGFAFGETQAFGILIALALAIHNIPEGLAISAVMVPKGTSVWKAAGWSIFSSLPQPIMAVPAFLFVSTFVVFLPAGLGFAAGAMFWLVAKELLPEAKEQVGVKLTYSIAGVSAFLMYFWPVVVNCFFN